jgi:ABC-type multidrug transport system ATPase subunit
MKPELARPKVTLSMYCVLMCFQKLKKDRTIIVATNTMREANEIGDRIAILQRGSIISEGTTEFMKTTLGKSRAFGS